MADLTGTNAEFNYSYTDNFTGSLASGFIVAAFGTPTVIVTLTIGAPAPFVTTIDAGYYSHVIDTQTAFQNYATTFDVGFTTTVAAGGSTYTNGSGGLTQGTGGPAEVNQGYGTLELGGALLNASNGKDSVTLKGVGNTLVLDNPTLSQLSSLPTITGFNQAGDQIVLHGIADTNAAIVSYSGGALTFVNNGTNSTLNLAGLGGGVTAGNFTVSKGTSAYPNDLVISFNPCFLRGTMIATPTGEVAVEMLRPGDLVTALEKGGPVARPVTWVGGGRMRVAEQADRDGALAIRILRHAFAMNVPHRDLLVTPEHCILTEAGLIPVRMLVNGASMVVDRTLTEYDYHHVELERHGILLAEGLSTESYLDTGNRAMFHTAAAGVAPRPDLEIAAPLAVARDAVEPIWTRLAERARTLGLGPMPTAIALTDQPDLRLLLDDGRELAACWHNRQRHMFHIPRGARPMRLLSRAAVPAQAVGPFVDDRRRLGVAVERLVLWTGLQERVLPAGGLALNGWHGAEGGLRWTDGNAALDLPCAGHETFLDIHVAGTMLYPDEVGMAA